MTMKLYKMQCFLHNALTNEFRSTNVELGCDLMQCSTLLNGYHFCYLQTVLFLHHLKVLAVFMYFLSLIYTCYIYLKKTYSSCYLWDRVLIFMVSTIISWSNGIKSYLQPIAVIAILLLPIKSEWGLAVVFIFTDQGGQNHSCYCSNCWHFSLFSK